MTFYADDIDGAYEDIADFANGLTCTINRGDETYPGIPCVILDFTWRERMGGLIEAQDYKLLLPAKGLSIIPAQHTDVVTLVSAKPGPYLLPLNYPLKLIGNSPIAPDNTPIIHQLQVRL